MRSYIENKITKKVFFFFPKPICGIIMFKFQNHKFGNLIYMKCMYSFIWTCHMFLCVTNYSFPEISHGRFSGLISLILAAILTRNILQ